MTTRLHRIAAAIASMVVTWALVHAVAGIAADSQPQAMRIAERIDPGLGKLRVAASASMAAPGVRRAAE